jgi:hypothetical protein
MKITFILPAIGKKQGQKYIGTWKMEPLTIAVLKSLTPSDMETELFDDRIELIDYSTKTDLVVITVETYTAGRSYSIAAEFKKRGIPVVMGGYHVTLIPQEAAEEITGFRRYIKVELPIRISLPIKVYSQGKNTCPYPLWKQAAVVVIPVSFVPLQAITAVNTINVTTLILLPTLKAVQTNTTFLLTTIW